MREYVHACVCVCCVGPTCVNECIINNSLIYYLKISITNLTI